MSLLRERIVPAPLRRRRTWVVVAAVVLVLAAAAVYVLRYTTVFAARHVTVSGVHAADGEALTRQQVLAAADVPGDRPLLRVDTAAIARRVGQLRGVARVDVQRAWPSGLRIVVTERTAVAFVRQGTAQWLVDADGVLFQHLLKPVGGIPKLTNDLGADPDAATRAALGVAAHLPKWLQAATLTISAQTPDSVQLQLSGDRTVVWGGDTDDAAKASALSALLKRPGHTYDVSSPKVVTVH